jgi:hypothetical protein
MLTVTGRDSVSSKRTAIRPSRVRLERRIGGGAGPDQEELVGPEPGRIGSGELAKGLGDAKEDVVPRRMAMRVVQQPEVVDVDQADRERAVTAARSLHGARQRRHDRAVVQHSGQRIAARGVDQLRLLTTDPDVRRPEDEEQDGGEGGGGTQHHDDDVALRLLDAREHRARVAPQRDDRPRLSRLVDDREVLTHRGRDRQRGPDDVLSRVVGQQRRRPQVRYGLLHLGEQLDALADDVRVAREQDQAVRRANLDPHDVVLAGQRLQLCAELARPRHARPIRVEVVGPKVAVHEELDERCVSFDAGVHRGGGQVGGGDGGEGRAGHADQDEEHAEDEQKQHRATPGLRRARRAGSRSF